MEPQKLAQLQELGLTEYEARAYTALLELESASAGRLAEHARVPRTKIYGALELLADKRLVDVVPEKPLRYIARPLDGFLDGLEHAYADRLDSVRGRREQLARAFAPAGKPTAEEGSFLLLKGRSNVAGRIAEMIARAGSDLLYVSTEGSWKHLEYHMDVLQVKASGGVRLRLLVPAQPPGPFRQAFERIGVVKEAFWPNPGVGAVIVDDAEALVVHFVPDDEHLFQGADVALWTNDRAMVAGLRAMIGAQWTLPLPSALTIVEGIAESP